MNTDTLIPSFVSSHATPKYALMSQVLDEPQKRFWLCSVCWILNKNRNYTKDQTIAHNDNIQLYKIIENTGSIGHVSHSVCYAVLGIWRLLHIYEDQSALNRRCVHIYLDQSALDSWCVYICVDQSALNRWYVHILPATFISEHFHFKLAWLGCSEITMYTKMCVFKCFTSKRCITINNVYK